jgi:hypothetical protein
MRLRTGIAVAACALLLPVTPVIAQNDDTAPHGLDWPQYNDQTPSDCIQEPTDPVAFSGRTLYKCDYPDNSIALWMLPAPDADSQDWDLLSSRDGPTGTVQPTPDGISLEQSVQLPPLGGTPVIIPSVPVTPTGPMLKGQPPTGCFLVRDSQDGTVMCDYPDGSHALWRSVTNLTLLGYVDASGQRTITPDGLAYYKSPPPGAPVDVDALYGCKICGDPHGTPVTFGPSALNTTPTPRTTSRGT